MRKELTKAEMDVMKAVWQKSKATVHGILEEMADPKPAYNTVATVLKVLEKKGFVGHEVNGRVHEFWPEVPREVYAAQVMDGVLGNFFGGSVVQMVSFFAEKESLSAKDFDKIVGILQGAKTGAKTGAEGAKIGTRDAQTSGLEATEKPKRARLWIK